MNGSTNFLKKFRLCLLLFSIQIQSQIYNDQLNLEKSDLEGPNIIRYNNIELEFHRRFF